METRLYAHLAALVTARLTCIASNITEWRDKHEDEIESLVKSHLPSDGGFERGTTIDLEASTGEELVFDVEYHHMDQDGRDDKWTAHTVTITPAFSGINLRISGRSRSRGRFEDYLDYTFRDALSVNMEDTHA